MISQQRIVISDNERIKNMVIHDYVCSRCELLDNCRVRIDFNLWVACESIDADNLINLAMVPEDVFQAVMDKLSWNLVDGEAVHDNSGNQILAAISRAPLGFQSSSSKSSQSSPNSLPGALAKIIGLLDAG